MERHNGNLMIVELGRKREHIASLSYQLDSILLYDRSSFH